MIPFSKLHLFFNKDVLFLEITGKRKLVIKEEFTPRL